MAKIIGNTTATPNPRPDWAQTDETKADYIKNKPIIGDVASLTEISKDNLDSDVQESLNKADSAIQSLDGYATEIYVGEQIASMVDSAPETLDTLNELAAALGDDPNFATTVATEIGKKVDKVEGKGLSANDLTDALKSKLEGIEDSANNYTHPEKHSADMIDGLASVATSGLYTDLIDVPIVDTEFEWGSSSKNAISHEAVANELRVMNSDIGMIVENLNGDISNLHEEVDKVSTQVNDLGDQDNAEVTLVNNYVAAYGVISSSLVCYMESTPSVGFSSALYFTTPTTIPENYTTFPDTIYFKGDSTDEGAFVPEANMRYTIVFDYDGYMTNAYVSEVATV